MTTLNKIDQSEASPNVSLHLVDDGAILFEADTQALFATFTRRDAIRHGLDRHIAPTLLAEALSRNYDMDIPASRRFVANEMRRWRKAPLRNGRRHRARAGLQTRSQTNSITETQIERRIIRQPSSAVAERQHCLLDTNFVLRYATKESFDWVEPILGHLGADGLGAKFNSVLDIGPFGEGYLISEGEKALGFCGAESQLAETAIACLSERAVGECDGRGAFQAATVERNGKCILMVGTTGVGKSCLAAGLSAEGFAVASDDAAVLDEQYTLRPVPLGVRVRKDAIPSLAARYPQMGNKTLHGCRDGGNAVYLHPPEIELVNPDRRMQADAIVFPSFDPNGGTEFISLSNVTAMERIFDCFRPLRDNFGPADVDELIDWVRDVPCFQLNHASLTDAVNLIGQIDK